MQPLLRVDFFIKNSTSFIPTDQKYNKEIPQQVSPTPAPSNNQPEAKVQPEGPVTCHYCDKRYSSQNVLDLHLKVQHKQGKNLIYMSLIFPPDYGCVQLVNIDYKLAYNSHNCNI